MGTTTSGPSGGVPAGKDAQSSGVSRWMFDLSRGYQNLLDKWNPHVRNRWIASSVLAILYVMRVLYLQGFYVISHFLGTYLLIILRGFLSPKVDPDGEDAPTLPTRASGEFRPFVRRLPEFKFWYSFTKAFSVAFVLTFFDVLDVPTFWPILLINWIFVFVLIMRIQILHMMKHKYLPFSVGKKTYGKTRTTWTESASLLM